MKINEKTFEITTSQYDYGVPVAFEAGKAQGFDLGDKVVFVFDSEALNDKVYTVDREDFAIYLSLSRAEADALFAEPLSSARGVGYSVKRYADGRFLETLVDSRILVRKTLKWEAVVNG